MYRQYCYFAPEGEATGGSAGQPTSEPAEAPDTFIAEVASQPAGDKPAAAPSQPVDVKPEAVPGEVKTTPVSELPGWANATTKELRADPRFADFAKKYSKFDEVVKSLIDRESEVRDVPTDPKGYELELDKDIEYLPEEVESFQALAHKLKLTKEQANELVKVSAEAAKKEVAAYRERQEADKKLAADQVSVKKKELTDALQAEWGDKYQENHEVVKRGVAAYGSPELLKALQDAGLGNNIEVIRHFQKVGMMMREDSATYKSGTTPQKKDAANILYPS